MKTYAVYFRYKRPGEKKPGNVSHYKFQADSLEEARTLAAEYANAPGVEIITVKQV